MGKTGARGSFPPVGTPYILYPPCTRFALVARAPRFALQRHPPTPLANPKQSKANASAVLAVSTAITRAQLIDKLNEDLAREYQAIISYVVYSQAIKGAAYMNIAAELEKHAGEELSHAITIAKQIDYLGGEIGAVPRAVKTSDDPKAMLRFDLDNEAETIKAYRERVKQCEALGEYALAEHIREILMQEQEHLTDLASALGIDPPNVSGQP